MEENIIMGQNTFRIGVLELVQEQEVKEATKQAAKKL
jgi:hypothetical protein